MCALPNEAREVAQLRLEQEPSKGSGDHSSGIALMHIAELIAHDLPITITKCVLDRSKIASCILNEVWL